MAGFNIKDIKVTSKVEKNLPKLLTGEYTTGIPKDSKLQKTAEIEGDEYVKYPEGNIQKAIGPSHEKGGIDMAMPDGTEVISKTTKLTKEDVEYITSKYDIDLSTKDSYASAIDKYTKSIGLKKLNDEQADIIATLKKQMENKAMDRETKTLNTDYLSNKIYDTEAKKAPLEAKRKEFFDLTFKLQEDKKPNSAAGEQTFKYGGISEESFKAMCAKHGLTEEQGKAILGETKKFADGGKMFDTFKNNIVEYKSNWSDQEFKDAISEQIKSGNLTTEDQTQLQNLWKATPKTNTDSSFIGDWGNLTGAELDQAKKEWNNNPKAYRAYKLAEKKFSDPAFQDAYFKKFQEIANDEKYYKTKNKEKYKKELTSISQKEAVDQLLAFEKRNAQLEAFGYEPKQDQQTAKGQVVNKNALDIIAKTNGVLKPEDFQKGYIGQAGYLAYNNLVGGDSKTNKTYKALATGQKDEPFGGGQISAIDNANTDTTLSQRLNVVEPTEPEKAIEPGKEPETNKEKAIDEGTPIKPFDVPQLKPRYPQMFFHPDQTALPPEGQTPELLVQNRLQRIDPVRIGIESELQAMNKAQQFASQQLDALPPSQRTAGIITALAATQEAEGQAILGANRTNAQNIINAEQFNIGQSDKENLLQGQNMLNFEQRTLQGKAQTDLDLRRYLNYNHNVAMQNYKDDQKLNLMNSLFPDYQVDFYGNVQYDPSMAFSVKDQDQRNQYMNFMKGPNPITATDAQTLI